MVEVTVPTTSETVTVLVKVAVRVVVCAQARKGSSRTAANEERCIATVFSKGTSECDCIGLLRMRYVYRYAVDNEAAGEW